MLSSSDRIFDTRERLAAADKQTNDCCIHGEDAPSYAMVKRWAAKFRQGRRSLQDETRSRRSGRSSEAVCKKLSCY